MNYPLVPLREVIKVHYGKALKESDRVQSGPWIVYGSSGPVGHHDKVLYEKPTIIIGRKGSVGEITYAPNGSWTIDTAFYVEISNSSNTDIRYLYYALRQAKLVKHTITTSIPGINRDNIYSTKIPLPPLPEQRRIATILDKADAIRRKRKRAIELTEDFLRSAFLEMFGDPVTNPRGWNRKPLSKLGAIVTGNTPSRKNPEYYGTAIEWIKSDNINTPKHYLTKAEEYLSEEGKQVGRVAPAASILVTCIAGTPECIGNVAIADREVAFNQQINALIPYQTTDHLFLYAQFLVAKKLVQRASTESMKGLVSKSRFSSIEFVVPPIDLRQQFCALFNRYYVMVAKLHRHSSLSNVMFDSLTHRAFRGELTTESAEEVLKEAATG